MYISILFPILFHYRLLQDIECSSLYYTIGSCCLSLLHRVGCISFFVCVFFCFVCLFRATSTAYGVPRLGVKSDLQPLAHTTTTEMPDPNQSATQTTAHQNTGSLTRLARPGIEPASSWILVRFVSTEPRWELQEQYVSLNPKLLIYLSPLSPLVTIVWFLCP